MMTLLIGCESDHAAEDSPEAAARRFYDSFLSGDSRAFNESLAADMSSTTRKTLTEAFSLWQTVASSAKGRIVVQAMTTRSISADVVEIDVTHSDASPDTVRLVKRNGQWKIQEFKAHD
jgi:hypothetical protein